MGDYNLEAHMFAIDIGGGDIVLGAKWLTTLGIVTINFKELYMSVVIKYQIYTLKVLQARSPTIIISD